MFDLKSTKSSLNERNGVRDAVTQIIQELSEDYRRTLKAKEQSEITLEAIHYGYLRINPKYGVQYQFNLSLTLPPSSRIPTNTTYWAKIDRAFSTIQGRIENVTRRTLNIIVPLKENYDKVRIMLARLEKAFLTDVEPIVVLIVYFQKSSGKTRHLQHINEIKKEFPEKTFRWLAIPGEFNRAEALQKATKHLGNNSLLFFSDVHLVFRKEFVYRCRVNTVKGNQVTCRLYSGSITVILLTLAAVNLKRVLFTQNPPAVGQLTNTDPYVYTAVTSWPSGDWTLPLKVGVCKTEISQTGFCVMADVHSEPW